MLDVRSIRKTFGNLVAVDGASFQAGKGETVGLLGPNGAGKTTIVSLIAGLLRPDSGDILIAGRTLRGDTDPAKRMIGLVPQDIGLYDELSARDNLALFAALYGLRGAERKRPIDAALDLVGLTGRAKDRVSGFSGGMKRRLNLAAALLHDPQLLLLDEPTVGVDPQSRNAIFENLEELKKKGKTLIYTTHYMEEAERLCDRLVIVDRGKVVADETLQGLHKLMPEKSVLRVELAGSDNGFPVDDLRRQPEVRSAEMRGSELRIGLRELSAEAPRILQWIADRGYPFDHVASERASLERVFLNLTGRSLRD